MKKFIVKDTSGPKKTVDIKTEIKKPDIKLVGKIDLEKTLKPKVEDPAPPKEEQEKKATGRDLHQKRNLKRKRLLQKRKSCCQ